MKVDILVLSAHPDDAELGCGGTIASHIAEGRTVGIVDFTKGELGTRGTAESRKQEASDAAKILGVAVRENLGLPDGFFQNRKEDQLVVIKAIRKFRPDIVLTNTTTDRHPDHGRGAQLSYDSCFLSGLMKIVTQDEEGKDQQAWRPKAVYHYMQSQFVKPDFVVDISNYWDVKINAILAFKTQFHNPDSKEPETYISDPSFLRMVESRALELGHSIGVKYGEGFSTTRYAGVRSLFDLV